jgi:4a-hydroxytetrahydrobiopterin dehydratase
MNKALSKQQIKTSLKTLNTDWAISTAGTSISRKFLFQSYLKGFMFVTKLSVHAEVALHHPEVLLTYSSVKVTLTTSDIKTLTKADFDLASTCDNLYSLSTKSHGGPHNHY